MIDYETARKKLNQEIEDLEFLKKRVQSLKQMIETKKQSICYWERWFDKNGYRIGENDGKN